MIISHNLLAMNSNRMLGINDRARAKSTERLSSGYKVNRAADDAAGLAMSEKMRRQIRGLTQASANCMDGISLCQVADGALNETQDILQRMNELAVKSANGTNSGEDRRYIQEEIRNLVDEVDRIAKTTTFNDDIYPLVKNGVAVPKEVTFTGPFWSFLHDAENTVQVKGGMELAYDGKVHASGERVTVHGLTVDGKSLLWDGGACNEDGSDYVTNDGVITKPLYKSDIKTDENGYLYLEGTTWVDKVYLSWSNGAGGSSFGVKASLDDPFGISLKADTPVTVKMMADVIEYGEPVYVQAGAEAGQHIDINFVDATARALGIQNLDVSTSMDADDAINRIKSAIHMVSGFRSEFGTTQNRLEHTVANLNNAVENTTAAESEIRDTDMAKEMVAYANHNILTQAGQSVLSQANQSQQGILSLLQ